MINETRNCAALIPFFSSLRRRLCSTPLSATSAAAAVTPLFTHTHAHTHTFHLRLFPLSSNKCTYDSPSATLQSDSLSVCGAQNGGMKTLKQFSCL